MSLHVELSSEARVELEKQRRKTTISSIVIALLAILLVLLLLALFALAPLIREIPTIVGYTAPVVEAQDDVVAPRTMIPNQARPAAASASSAAASRVIAANNASAVAIAVPQTDVESISLDYGMGDSFGDGFGMGDGFGEGVGQSSMGFGSSARLSSALRGKLYDLKQDRRGNATRGYNPTSFYNDTVKRIMSRDFSASALADFFEAPQELSLTQLAIPFTPATEGPKYFGAEKEVEPSGWIAHYQAKISANQDGEYRFVGFGDDYLSVALNKKVRLMASWPGTQEHLMGRWKPTEPVKQWMSPLGQQYLVCGDWIPMKAGEEFHMDLGIGERPGGMVGFVLLVEKKGEEYRKDSAGRTILPLFSTAPFSQEVREEITKQFPTFEFEWEKTPIFNAR